MGCLVELCRKEEQRLTALDLGGVLNAAIGQFGRGVLALLDGVLLLSVRLTAEGQGFGGFGGGNGGSGRFVGLAEEGKFHGGSVLRRCYG